MNCISYFLRGNKTYFILRSFLKEKNKIGRVPRFRGVFIYYVKLFTVFNTSKMFYLTNNCVPLLYCQSFSTFSSSCRNHFSSVFSFHSCSKSVCSFSWCVMWLECSFHFSLSLIYFTYITVVYLDAILSKNGLNYTNFIFNI